MVYLNGTEVLRYNMPAGPIAFNTRPTDWVGGVDETFQEYTIDGAALVDGANLMTVEVHNFWPGNPDLSFDACLRP